ncbi:MAG: XdhC family protein, partial [Halobacteriaceae archaeon]
MSESDVLASVSDVLGQDGRGVLATVIDVEGSAYRRPGAKMIVPEKGDAAGHITAGCLEDEVSELAGEVLDEGEPRVETYDLRPDSDEDVWGLGVGCNGIIDILLEPINDSYRPVIDAHDSGNDIGVMTVVNADDPDVIGARAYYHPDDASFSPEEDFPAEVIDDLQDVAKELT